MCPNVKGAWWATVHGVTKELDMTEHDTFFLLEGSKMSVIQMSVSLVRFSRGGFFNILLGSRSLFADFQGAGKTRWLQVTVFTKHTFI